MKRILPSCMLIATWACSSTDRMARIDPGAPPSGAEFAPVAQVLVEHCGSLDCHGSSFRNLRIYGFGGGRANPATQPDSTETTDEEVALDYDAVLGIEPGVMRRVVEEGGRDPQRLTFVRKGRGEEGHKGGQRIMRGDPTDRCITSWLAGSVDAAACQAAVPRLAKGDAGTP